MEVGLKRLAGASAALFLEQKLDILLDELRRTGRLRADPSFRYLDFGCGAGDFLSLVARRGLGWSCEGCDVSQGMLQEARKRWSRDLQSIPLWPIEPDQFPAARFDLISAVCVFHHIPPDQWIESLRRLKDALVPGGWLAVFEHNPWNPATNYVVRRTEIDRNAVLLSPAVARDRLAAAGFGKPRTRFFLFAPPRFRFLWPAEKLLARVPVGGQYALFAQKDPG